MPRALPIVWAQAIDCNCCVSQPMELILLLKSCLKVRPRESFSRCDAHSKNLRFWGAEENDGGGISMNLVKVVSCTCWGWEFSRQFRRRKEASQFTSTIFSGRYGAWHLQRRAKLQEAKEMFFRRIFCHQNAKVSTGPPEHLQVDKVVQENIAPSHFVQLRRGHFRKLILCFRKCAVKHCNVDYW